MIDLHSHTYESDGTLSPEELIRAAADLRLEALGVCDHDTFAGYDQAVEPARQAGLDLVCGIELSTKGARGRSIHVLGYFLNGGPSRDFRDWLGGIRQGRRDRNRRLAARLQSLGIDIQLEEVEALGRSQAGRPHFAKLMLERGYVATLQEAFDRYLAESAQAYVERDEPPLDEGVRRIAEAGGLASLAHPVRLGLTSAGLGKLIDGAGLRAIEVYHSEHQPHDVETYLDLARRHDLVITGGTDFHGGTKPGLQLGTGFGNVAVPRSVLDDMRAAAERRASGA
jgi:predicted metal-dependent phosphoesterase TrpH